jgi:hypothetical protein
MNEETQNQENQDQEIQTYKQVGVDLIRLQEKSNEKVYNKLNNIEEIITPLVDLPKRVKRLEIFSYIISTVVSLLVIAVIIIIVFISKIGK